MNDTNAPAAPPRIYTDPSQSEVTVSLLADMDMLESKLENMPAVQTEEDAELVSEYRAQFRTKHSALDKERLAMTAGARQTVAMMNEKYNAILGRMDRCTQLADGLLKPYLQERERIRQEEERKRQEAEAEQRRLEQEKADAEAEAERIANETQDAEALKEAETKVEDARSGLDALHRTPVAKPAPKSVTGVLGSKTHITENWKYRVSDISKVPEEYLVPPEERIQRGKLNAVARRDKENAIVPGIEFYSEDGLSSSAGVRK